MTAVFCPRRLALITAAFLTLIGVLAATGIDIIIIERLDKLPQSFRYAMTYVTEFGKSEYYLVPALLGAVFFLWRGKQSILLCARVRHYWRASVCAYLFACIAIAGLTGNLLKFLIGRARPKEWLESGHYGFDPFSLASRWHSFPSGHTNTMVCVAIALLPFMPQRWRGVAIGVIAVIIASRCIVAAHYVSDILGGALLAVLVCGAIERTVRRRYRLPFGPVKFKLGL